MSGNRIEPLNLERQRIGVVGLEIDRVVFNIVNGENEPPTHKFIELGDLAEANDVHGLLLYGIFLQNDQLIRTLQQMASLFETASEATAGVDPTAMMEKTISSFVPRIVQVMKEGGVDMPEGLDEKLVGILTGNLLPEVKPPATENIEG